MEVAERRMWVLFVYVITGSNAYVGSTVSGFKTQDSCLLASKRVTLTSGSATLAFTCIKK